MKRSFMFGVYCGLSDLANEHALKLMSELGAGWIRTALTHYPFMDPGRNRLNEEFLAFEHIIRKTRASGFRLMVVTYLPKHLPKSFGKPGSNEYFKNCKDLCAFLAGYFSAEIQHWVISNEMNLEMFRKPLTMDEALQYLKSCGEGIKEGNPSSEICVNMAGFDESAFAMFKKLFQDGPSIFDYAGADGYFGSWHPGGPSGWDSALERLYAVAKRPILIQEFGYSSKGSVMTDDERATGIYPCKLKKWWFKWKNGHTEEEQAEYLKKAVEVFLSKRYVAGAFYFCWKDQERCWQCGSPNCPVETGWGLVDTKGRPKPSYYAYQQIIKESAGTGSSESASPNFVANVELKSI